MPFLTRMFLRTSLVYFVLALIAGVMLAAGAMGFTVIPGLRPVYFHLLMVGWVTQLIVGVALWMFPKLSQERPRGSEALTWAVYGLLNAGLVLRVVAEPVATAGGGEVWGWLLVVSAALQMLGGWAFVANVWGRVKAH